MGPKSPETSASQNITTLRKTVNEGLASASEITVTAENVGAQKWQEMLRLMQETGRETRMDVFFNRITRKFIPGSIVIGEERASKKGPDSPVEFSDVDGGLNKLFCDRVVSTHTHPMGPEEAQMKTSVPSGKDLIKFLINTEGAMIIIDRGGAHLLIKIREFIAKDPSIERRTRRRPLQADNLAGGNFEGEDLPSEDLVQNKIDEVKEKDGIIADVQAELNTMFSPYGVRYLFCPAADISTSKDGTITFRSFTRADAKRERETLDENRSNGTS